MPSFELSIGLTAAHCNRWPWLQITCDQSILYDNEIHGGQNLTLTIPFENNLCNIKLIGIKKYHDTKIDSDGKIIEDKSLRIDNISINDINMGDEFIRHLNFKDEQGNEISFLNQTFYLNGSISIDINQPIIDWIIEKKFIVLLPTYGNSTAKYETTFSKFEYKLLNEKIAKIEALINDKNLNL
jgi:hypothetical protein